MKILLAAGHSNKEQGAWAYDKIDTEYNYWKRVTRQVAMQFIDDDQHSIEFAARDNGEDRELFYDLIDSYDLIIECHYNAHSGHVRGAEVLIAKEDTVSKELANTFLSLLKTAGRHIRGVKELNEKDRGYKNLQLMKSKATCAILIEPFFGDNMIDYMDTDCMERILTAYVNLILKNA